ncbi:MAG TPA: EsaB/YukD family protein, partial [Mycobacterium sp.]|nr:EsaB/YukD family protein [Mycobacterium sp.]
MTAIAAAAPTTSSVTPGQPSTTRVTILTGRRMTDLVLPASAPIETYIDEAVSVLAELLEDTPKDVLAGFEFSAQGVWAFARPGAPPLKADESLDDAG